MTAVGVNAGAVTAAVAGAGAGHTVAKAHAIAHAASGMNVTLAADHADTNVIDVVDIITEDEEAIHITVQGEGFTGGGFTVADFVIGDDDIGVGGRF